MFLWGFFRSLDGGEAEIDAGRLLSAQRFLLRWESRSALPRLHAHCPRALREVWVVTVRPSSCMSSDRSPVVCRSSVECTAAFDCTTRQQDISSSFSPARMALSPLPAPRLGSVSVFVQLHHCCCLIGPVAVRSLFCAHVASSVCPVACKYPHPLPCRSDPSGSAMALCNHFSWHCSAMQKHQFGLAPRWRLRAPPIVDAVCPGLFSRASTAEKPGVPGLDAAGILSVA